MKKIILNKLLTKLLIAGLLLSPAVLSACEEEGTTAPTGEVKPGTVTGKVVDSKGRPISGAKVRIENDLTYYDVTTDAQGRYTSPTLPAGGFKAVAWATFPYLGQNYTLRLGMPQASDHDFFDSKTGAVRNFVWQISGPIPDREGAFYGGTVELMNGTGSIFDERMNPGDQVRVTFIPAGPLIDGSTGQRIDKDFTIRSGNDSYLLTDIPTGQYEISAVRITPGGQQERLLIGTFSQQWEAALISFPPGGYGIGTYENGLARISLFMNLNR